MEKGFRSHCLIFVLAICFVYTYQVSSTPLGKSMLDKINVCPTVSFVKDSSYVSKCSKLSYSNVFKEDKDLAMCMVVYDVMSKICTFNSIAVEANKLNLPESVDEFDFQVKKLEPNPTDSMKFIANFCENVTTILFNRLNNTGIEISSDVVPFVEYVFKTLLKNPECGFTCHDVNKGNKVDSLCIFLSWTNNFFSTVQSIDVKHKAVPVITAQIEAAEKNTKNVPTATKIEENSDHNNENPINTNKDTLNPPVAKNLPSTDIKKPDETNIQPVDVSNPNVNKLDGDQKPPEISKQSDDIKGEIMQGPVKTSSVVSKTFDNIADNPNVVQSDKVNSADDFISAEDHQNKKPDDIDTDDGNARDNVENDVKDAMDDGNFGLNNNLANQDEVEKESKKFYAHSSLIKEEDESHFFTYFSIASLLCVGLYAGYHNKQKILAMVLEGRRSRRSRGSRRRPSTASYRKLDCNLEEAVTSQCNANVTHVIY